MNVILIGMPLSGKSQTGAYLAQRLNYYFYDSDELLKQKFGSIENAFSGGEQAFRNAENQVIDGLLTKNDCVVSSGGGLVTTKSGRELIKKFDCVIYLECSTEALIKRFALDKDRPLLKTENDIAELLKKRKDYYSSLATFSLAADSASPAALAKAAEQTIKMLFSK